MAINLLVAMAIIRPARQQGDDAPGSMAVQRITGGALGVRGRRMRSLRFRNGERRRDRLPDAQLDHEGVRDRAHARSPASVAAALGFADQAHLTRQFKQRVGVPPGVLRRMPRGSEIEGSLHGRWQELTRGS